MTVALSPSHYAGIGAFNHAVDRLIAGGHSAHVLTVGEFSDGWYVTDRHNQMIFGPDCKPCKTEADAVAKRDEIMARAIKVATVSILAERRMPPHPRGTVKMLRERGHTVLVRQTRTGSLRYKLDNECERTALELSNRLRKLHGVG